MIEVAPGYTYLDWAATAPLCEEAARAMEPFLAPGRANIALGMNANSLHSPGRAAYQAMEEARRTLACAIGAKRPSEVVFTSGATEADNAVILGVARAAARKRGAGKPGFKPRVVITKVEHEAVVEPARKLAGEGFEVVHVPCDARGFVSAQAVGEAIGPDTVLVSVQAANSEVGAVQPIAEIACLAHGAGALMHTDATQAFGKIPFDADGLGIDAASFSAHKIGGPKGIGALYLKARTPFEPILLGGGQEGGLRSTTQNVCGMAGFAAAAEAAVAGLAVESARQRAMRDALYARLAAMPGVRPTVEVPPGSEGFLPNIVHVLARGLESETLILRLDAAGFGVSGGSACASRSLEPSRVLKAMGVPSDDAFGALRISFGRYTERGDLERFASALADCLNS